MLLRHQLNHRFTVGNILKLKCQQLRKDFQQILIHLRLDLRLQTFLLLQGEDRKKWPPMKIGFLDYNFVKRAENVEKFINRTEQLPNMTEGLTLLNLKCNFHHTNR